MATHSSVLAWIIPWTEEPGGLHPWAQKESDRAEQLTDYFHFPPPLLDNPAFKKSVYIGLKQHICSQVNLRKRFLVAPARICFISLREVVTEHWFLYKGKGQRIFLVCFPTFFMHFM